MLAPFPDSFALMGREVVHHHLSGRKRRGKNPLDVCLKHLLGSAPRQLGTIPSRGVPCLRSLWGIAVARRLAVGPLFLGHLGTLTRSGVSPMFVAHSSTKMSRMGPRRSTLSLQAPHSSSSS